MKQRLLLGSVAVLALGATVWALWPNGSPSGDAADPGGEERAPGPANGELTLIAQGQNVDGGSRVLSGVVVLAGEGDQPDQPVAGVRVVAYPGDLAERLRCPICDLSAFECTDAHSWRSVVAAIRAPGFVPEPLAEALTDQQGQFHFDALPGQDIRLVARHQGLHTGIAVVGADETEVTVRVAPVSAFSLQVLAKGQDPIPGAHVVLFDLETGELHEQDADDHGTVSLNTAATTLWAYAEKPGWLPFAGDFSSGDVIALSKPHTLAVHTVRGNEPVEAEVTLTVEGSAHQQVLKTTNGEALFTNLAEQPVSVVAKAPPLVSAPEQVTLGDTDNPSDRTDLIIDLRPAARLHVTVMNANGEPVPDAHVSLSTVGLSVDYSGNETSAGETGPGGDVVLGPVPEGGYSLSVYVSSSEPPQDVTRAIEIRPGENVIEVTITSHAIHGRVVDGAGTPVVGAELTLEDEVNMNAPSTTSGDNGEFDLDVTEAGKWQLRVTHELGAADLEVVSPSAAPVVVVLETRATLDVFVTDDRGSPLPAAKGNQVDVVTDKSSPHANLDERGHAHFAGLPPGPAHVAVRSDGMVARECAVDIVANAHQNITCALSRSATISGTVAGLEPGTKIEGYVLATPVAEGDETTRSVSGSLNEDGTFSVVDLPSGAEFEVSVQMNTHTQGTPVRVKAPSEHVVLQVTALQKVSGSLVDEHGQPVRSRFIINSVSYEPGDGHFEASVDQHGAVSISAVGYRSTSLTVTPDQRELGKITLKAVAPLTGRVVDSAGRPVAGAQVRSAEFSGDPVTTDANGAFVADLTESENTEPFEVTAVMRRLSGRALVPRGGTATIAMVGPTRVYGKVYGPDGNGREAGVMVDCENAVSTSFTSSSDGSFMIELPAGPCTFTTRTNRSTRVVDIHGETQEVQLGVAPGTCGVVVDFGSPSPTYARLVPGTSVANIIDDPPGTITLGASGHADGVPCGDYVLLATFDFATTSETPVTLRGAETHVTPRAAEVRVLRHTPEPDDDKEHAETDVPPAQDVAAP